MRHSGSDPAAKQQLFPLLRKQARLAGWSVQLINARALFVIVTWEHVKRVG